MCGRYVCIFNVVCSILCNVCIDPLKEPQDIGFFLVLVREAKINDSVVSFNQMDALP
jgi:hypothetical protein